GLYDMHGNACERCSDWYDYYKEKIATYPCRGRNYDPLGCWFEEPINSQTAVQYHANDVVLSYFPERLGFRVVAVRLD
ncbi:MAG: SUMF1/EgtB/PvdO family nonheme iron enzyme, partial [Planctomycetota bacterium]